MLTIAYLNNILLHAEFSAMDYALNIVSKFLFSLYLNIHGLRKGPGKFFMGVLESLRKVLDFFVSKRVGTVSCVGIVWDRLSQTCYCRTINFGVSTLN